MENGEDDPKIPAHIDNHRSDTSLSCIDVNSLSTHYLWRVLLVLSLGNRVWR